MVVEAGVAPAPPARGALGRLAAPLGTAGAVAGSFLVVRLLDPHRPGHYPVCPSWALFGVYCPLCGGLRAANDLTHGDVAAAASSNVLVVSLLPLALVLWLRWARARYHGSDRPLLALTTRQVAVVGIVLLAFAVVRNLPWGAALAP